MRFSVVSYENVTVLWTWDMVLGSRGLVWNSRAAPVTFQTLSRTPDPGKTDAGAWFGFVTSSRKNARCHNGGDHVARGGAWTGTTFERVHFLFPAPSGWCMTAANIGGNVSMAQTCFPCVILLLFTGRCSEREILQLTAD